MGKSWAAQNDRSHYSRDQAMVVMTVSDYTALKVRTWIAVIVWALGFVWTVALGGTFALFCWFGVAAVICIRRLMDGVWPLSDEIDLSVLVRKEKKDDK